MQARNSIGLANHSIDRRRGGRLLRLILHAAILTLQLPVNIAYGQPITIRVGLNEMKSE